MPQPGAAARQSQANTDKLSGVGGGWDIIEVYTTYDSTTQQGNYCAQPWNQPDQLARLGWTAAERTAGVVDLLPLLDFAAIGAAEPTWMVGFSDISTLITRRWSDRFGSEDPDPLAQPVGGDVEAGGAAL